MGFDDLIGRCNSFAVERLSKATATVGTNDPFSVIFDSPYQGVSPQTNEIESYSPAATAQSSDVVANSIAHGTAITITGTPGGEYDGSYSVIGIEPDGQGMTKLILERQ